MSEPMPKDVVVQLRQVAAVPVGASIGHYPEWFQEEYEKENVKAWPNLLIRAADELEQMQQLAGRYLRRLAGD
jgi:hypothetical protein